MPSTHKAEFSQIIRAPMEQVIAAVQDAMNLINLNPMVVDVHQNDTSKYIITDVFHVFGCIPMKTQYETLATVYSGAQEGPIMKFQTKASGGTTLNNVWTIKQVEENVCEVTESVHVEASSFVMPIIKSTLASAHTSLLDSLAKKIEGRPVTTLPSTSRLGPLSLVIITLLPVLVACLYFISIIKYLCACCLLFWLHQKIRDPYDDTFHLVLNTRPGASSTDPKGHHPPTEWLNMGYWKDTNVFPEAAEALALKLIEAGHCRRLGRVLDVGHACGDSLLVHLQNQNVPSPLTLTGVTSLASHHRRAERRIDDCIRAMTASASGAHPATPTVVLHCTDAICRDPISRDHPLSPLSLDPPYTSILALDCAYHFRPREMFLRQSFARLAPGGYLALADIAVSSDYLDSSAKYLNYLLAYAFALPSTNLISPAMYAQQLVDIGFEDVQVQDITDDVFPGFRAFLRTQSTRWRVFEKVLGAWVNLGRRFVLVSARKP